MTKFMNPSFSSRPNTKAFRDNWDQTFRRKEKDNGTLPRATDDRLAGSSNDNKVELSLRFVDELGREVRSVYIYQPPKDRAIFIIASDDVMESYIAWAIEALPKTRTHGNFIDRIRTEFKEYSPPYTPVWELK